MQRKNCEEQQYVEETINGSACMLNCKEENEKALFSKALKDAQVQQYSRAKAN